MEAVRVLIVEDDPLIAMMLERFLADKGYEICATATTQAEAVMAALQYRPGLMIVDVQLRSGTGTGAVEEIGRTVSIPHVFLSGAPARVHAHWPDAEVLSKPFRFAALASAIERTIATAAGL
jgi:DNA-binding response OmpR family regulator